MYVSKSGGEKGNFNHQTTLLWGGKSGEIGATVAQKKKKKSRENSTSQLKKQLHFGWLSGVLATALQFRAIFYKSCQFCRPGGGNTNTHVNMTIIGSALWQKGPPFGTILFKMADLLLLILSQSIKVRLYIRNGHCQKRMFQMIILLHNGDPFIGSFSKNSGPWIYD